ncbi:glutamate racemase [Virgibacillus sp. W0430]|uniref:glutamate racemase n=1 Tax=Virgibacillus sp. W0430 TaxID=3391580 RepID=UPI003F4853D6
MKEPIGVIDSGVGGLTVAYELIRQLPKENIVYLGDTLRCPYGPRSQQEVQQFTWEMVHFLLNKNIKMLIIACNTATAFTLEQIQKAVSIPVLGVIQPGARAAINVTKNNHVAIIATEGTITSNAYPHVLKNINPELQVYSLACPLLVPMVEQGILNGQEAEYIVIKSLAELRKNNLIDTLILGCTHYPIIQHVIKKVMDERVSIISSGEETAREASAILDYSRMRYTGSKLPTHQFFTTGDLSQFKNVYSKIFNSEINEVQPALMRQIVLN